MNKKEFSFFSQTILNQKYAHDLPGGGKEDWDMVSKRVATTVLKSVNAPKTLIEQTIEYIQQRKFIPGGRYLYASGRPFHQVNNCLLMRAEDSREGWAEHLQKNAMGLMTGAGIGTDYSLIRPEGKPIRKTGGLATGPLALMEVTNQLGRGVMQGGSRRSALWAGLRWDHADIMKFIAMKNWTKEVRDLKAADFNFPAMMDMTNISVSLDDDFFEAINDENNSKQNYANVIYWAAMERMLKTGEPGFSINLGKNRNETLRNACVPGYTQILTKRGYRPIESLVNTSIEIWNGFEWSEVTPKITGRNQELITVSLSSGQKLTCTKNHKFVISLDYFGNTERIDANDLKIGMKLIKNNYPVLSEGINIPENRAYTQGFISAEGMDDYKQFTVYSPKYICLDRLEINPYDFKKILKNPRITVYPTFTALKKSFVPFDWNLQSKLNWLAGLLDGDGTVCIEGGIQLCSIDKKFLIDIQKMLTTMGTASKLNIGQEEGYKQMPDGKGGYAEYFCQTSYRLLIGAKAAQNLLDLGLICSRLKLDFTPNRDASRFIQVAGIESAGIADIVYCFTEPKRNLGCFEGIVTGQCTELVSSDDSDVCNLGSINLARIESVDEMKAIVECSSAFLLAGTVYSDVPYNKVDTVRTKNRRLGLGLMGIHEWLLIHGKRYEADQELDKYLEEYAQSGKYAKSWASKWDLSNPVKTRAIAPTGTIGILAETTTGCEPLFCTAYKRRYLKGNVWQYQYVIDPTAKRLIDEGGINPENIEDAYTLAEDVERRLAFQAHLQKYVDHAISSTINLPQWGSEFNNQDTVQKFGKIFLKYLPLLRGLTTYPDGSRSGQPLNPVKYSTALKHGNEVFVEASDICVISGKGGSCGS